MFSNWIQYLVVPDFSQQSTEDIVNQVNFLWCTFQWFIHTQKYLPWGASQKVMEKWN